MSVKIQISNEFLAICRSKDELQKLLQAVRAPQEKLDHKIKNGAS